MRRTICCTIASPRPVPAVPRIASPRAIRYGLTRPVLSNNPIRIAFNEWIALGRALRATRGARARLSRCCSGRPDYGAVTAATTSSCRMENGTSCAPLSA